MTTRMAVAAGVAGPVVAFALCALGAGPPGNNFGDPLPGLTAEQRGRFLAGKAGFEEEGEIETGLGPVMTGTSCIECHSNRAAGGSGTQVETRIGAWIDGRFDPLIRFGGPVIQPQTIGSGVGYRGAYRYDGEVVPPQATITAGRRSTPLFGLGLVDAVPDETFLRIAEYQRWVSPATAGRPHPVVNAVTGRPAVGKFGWKAQLASVFEFTGDAYANEMGVTTPLVPEENSPQGDRSLLASNPAPDPNNADNQDLVEFTDFITFLGPPPRGKISGQVRAGETVFSRIGCASCHLPTLQTGHHPVAALDRVTFHPFSDFLLHDMGGLGDGIEQGQATGREMRTAPLWGVRVQTKFLHDGRADTLEEAILAHDGQGQPARDRFAALNARRRSQLLAYLNSL